MGNRSSSQEEIFQMESTMLDLAALAVATQHNPFLGHYLND